MGLVDYSESDSSSCEAEASPARPTKADAGAGAGGKKPFQPVVDKSNPGRIIVSLPGTTTTTTATGAAEPTDERPAKRARTAGGGRFSGFNSFLPAPKNPAATVKASGVGLRTSAAPGFTRDTATAAAAAAGGTLATNGEAMGKSTGEADITPRSPGLGLPPPKMAGGGGGGDAGQSMPDGRKPALGAKSTGTPLMFRPLSVAKGKKKTATTTTTSTAAPKPKPAQPPSPATVAAARPPTPEPPKKKVSLFSLPPDDTTTTTTTTAPGPSLSGTTSTGTYEPLFETAVADDYAAAYASDAAPAAAPVFESAGDIADDMGLSAAARRELFGRAGGNSAHAAAAAAKSVINFNMDHEYQHNEALRASGEQQTHNPVRSIQGGGKHSLRQLVSRVQTQKDALEDSFAKGRASRREASSRYGW